MNNPQPHPPRVYRSTATTVFMGTLGTIMALLSVSFPLVTLAHSLGLVAVAPAWGLFSGITVMVFSGLVAVEFFTGHINAYAGELVRAMVERVSGKAGADK